MAPLKSRKERAAGPTAGVLMTLVRLLARQAAAEAARDAVDEAKPGPPAKADTNK
jgi:hypothetical protein